MVALEISKYDRVFTEGITYNRSGLLDPAFVGWSSLVINTNHRPFMVYTDMDCWV